MRYAYKIIRSSDRRWFEHALNEAGKHGWKLDKLDVNRGNRLTDFVAVMVRAA